ncbi:unnamed protein product [Aphanomyces euteiches]
MDKSMVNFTTVVVITLTTDRPDKKLRSTSGAVVSVVTPIATMTVNKDAITVTSSQLAVYDVAVGLTFPYEWERFEPVTLEELNSLDCEWKAKIISTGEAFTMAGTTGFFRDAPDVQSAYNRYTWDLPSDPIEYASTIRFTGAFVYKDAWGWFRCFLGLGIASNLIMNMLVALMVTVNMWKQNRVLWVPDIYPPVQGRAALRGLLLILDSIWNNWFYPYQFAFNLAEIRNSWPGSLYMESIPRADGLILCLGLAYGVSHLSKVRIRLFIIVLIYGICFHYKIEIVNTCGLFSATTSNAAAKIYFDNIIPGTGGMDLWAYREDSSVNFAMIINEFTWLFIAMAVSVIYIFVTKLIIRSLTNSNKVQSTPVMSSQANSVNEAKLKIALRKGISFAKAKTHFEQSAGALVSDVTGFVGITTDYTDKTLVSASGVWLLGYVILADRFAIHINDYFFVLLNAAMQMTYFRIYAFEIQGDVVATRKQRLSWGDVPFRYIHQVSLKDMR